QVEHERERQRGDAVDRKPEQLEELELRLRREEPEQVAPGRSRGRGRGYGCGCHADTPSRSWPTSLLAGWWWWLVIARKASSSEAPVTSRPVSVSSAASRALTVASAWVVRSCQATPRLSTCVTPGSEASFAALRLVTARTTLPEVRALISDGEPSASTRPRSSRTMRSARASASSR